MHTDPGAHALSFSVKGSDFSSIKKYLTKRKPHTETRTSMENPAEVRGWSLVSEGSSHKPCAMPLT